MSCRRCGHEYQTHEELLEHRTQCREASTPNSGDIDEEDCLETGGREPVDAEGVVGECEESYEEDGDREEASEAMDAEEDVARPLDDREEEDDEMDGEEELHGKHVMRRRLEDADNNNNEDLEKGEGNDERGASSEGQEEEGQAAHPQMLNRRKERSRKPRKAVSIKDMVDPIQASLIHPAFPIQFPVTADRAALLAPLFQFPQGAVSPDSTAKTESAALGSPAAAAAAAAAAGVNITPAIASLLSQMGIPGLTLPATNVTLEALQNTKVAVAQFAASALAASGGAAAAGAAGGNNTEKAAAAIQELAVLQSTLYTLQHQQMLQLQLIQQLQQQLQITRCNPQDKEDGDEGDDGGRDEDRDDGVDGADGGSGRGPDGDSPGLDEEGRRSPSLAIAASSPSSSDGSSPSVAVSSASKHTTTPPPSHPAQSQSQQLLQRHFGSMSSSSSSKSLMQHYSHSSMLSHQLPHSSLLSGQRLPASAPTTSGPVSVSAPSSSLATMAHTPLPATGAILPPRPPISSSSLSLTPGGTGSSQTAQQTAASILASTIITNSDPPPPPTEPNTLEMLQRRAEEVLDSASQGLLGHGLADELASASGRKGGSGKPSGGLSPRSEPFFKHRCRYCGKVFGSDSALQIHIRSHTGERPFKCNVCGSRFTTKGNLKVHFQRHTAKFPHIKMNPNPAQQDTPENLSKPQQQTSPPPQNISAQTTCKKEPCDEAESANEGDSTIRDQVSREEEGEESEERMGRAIGEEGARSSPKTEPDSEAERYPSPGGVFGADLSLDSKYSGEDMGDEDDGVMPMDGEDDDCQDERGSREDGRSGSTPGAEGDGDSIQDQPENLSKSVGDRASSGDSVQRLPASLPFPLGSSTGLGGRAASTSPTLMHHTGIGMQHFLGDVDPAKDPAIYTSLLPRPGSNDNSWESLIEVTKTSETSKLQQLVDNIEHKLTDPNQCVICHRVLSCKSALQMHYRTHTGERPFRCKICGRAFTTKGNLKTHMGVHRAKPPTRLLHQCPVCHRRFTNSLVLQQHIRLHTGEPTDLTPDQIRAAEVKDFPPSPIPPPMGSHPAAAAFASSFLRQTPPPPHLQHHPFSGLSPLHPPPPPPHLGLHPPPTPPSHTSPKPDTGSEDMQDKEESQRRQDVEDEDDLGEGSQMAAEDEGGDEEESRGSEEGLAERDVKDEERKNNWSDEAGETPPISAAAATTPLQGQQPQYMRQGTPLSLHSQQVMLPASLPPTSSAASFSTSLAALENQVRTITTMAAAAAAAAAANHHDTTAGHRGDRSPGSISSPCRTNSPSVGPSRVSPAVSESNSLGALDLTPRGSAAGNGGAGSGGSGSVGGVGGGNIGPLGAMGGGPPHPPVFSAFGLMPPSSASPLMTSALSSLTSSVLTSTAFSPMALSVGPGVRGNTTCNICYKTFACNSALEIHYRSHTKERPFKCSICDRGFSTKGNMKQHMLTHKIRDMPPHLFEASSRSPSAGPQGLPMNEDANHHGSGGSNGSITSGMQSEDMGSMGEAKTITGPVALDGSSIKRPPESEGALPIPKRPPGLPKHLCHVCNKNFSSSSALQIHMRTHTGDKPFKCTICQKAFTTKGNLKVHMGTHMWSNGASRRGRRMSLDLPPIPMTPKDSEFLQRRPDLFYPYLPAPFLNGMQQKLNEISVIQSANSNHLNVSPQVPPTSGANASAAAAAAAVSKYAALAAFAGYDKPIPPHHPPPPPHHHPQSGENHSPLFPPILRQPIPPLPQALKASPPPPPLNPPVSSPSLQPTHQQQQHLHSGPINPQRNPSPNSPPMWDLHFEREQRSAMQGDGEGLMDSSPTPSPSTPSPMVTTREESLVV
ncbi:hypothetical protein J437_LFUL013162 [Ladona fulva]|uniref:Homeotic protein spalt-major n=1 Tax=Ladona fulva TaxID=123851 RepID=A0A8K0KF82_LADFU|nr:hypothetical protein J437_LFUL013162 [Ladona fulva]